MLRQIRLLTKLNLCNLFGWNEFLHTKDKKRRRQYIGFSVLWLLLLVMAVSYIGGLAYGLSILGLADIVPAYLYAVTSVVIVVLTFLKAGSVLFGQKGYELVVSLPVRPAVIVVSRFLTMYVTSLALSVFVMASGCVVYGVLERPALSFYVTAAAGTVVLPVLPLTVAAVIGAGITAVSSRMKHKSLVAAGITVAFVMALLVISILLSGNVEAVDAYVLNDLPGLLQEQIGKMYPPAVWFCAAVLSGGGTAAGLPFLLFAAGSLLLFVLFVALLQKHFLTICTALNGSTAKNDYKLRSLTQSTAVTALWKKELRRYFASSLYVTNTILGNVMMAALPAALFFVGAETIDELFMIPGIAVTCMPVLLGAMPALMPTTSSAISIEGKQWWLMQTLPVRWRDMLHAKILLNLTVAAPFFVVAEVFAFLALKPSLLAGMLLVAVPALHILFSAVTGLLINLKFPVFDWDNEMRAVKQSAAVLVAMLIGFISTAVPVVCLLFLPQVFYQVILAVWAVILLAGSGIAYIFAGRIRV